MIEEAARQIPNEGDMSGPNRINAVSELNRLHVNATTIIVAFAAKLGISDTTPILLSAGYCRHAFSGRYPAQLTPTGDGLYWPECLKTWNGNLSDHEREKSFLGGELISQLWATARFKRQDDGAIAVRDFDEFVVSAKGETSTAKFQAWAGSDRATLAIVFTDVVGSTALGEEIRDEAMNVVRRAHFDQSRKLIDKFKGREIKTIGDSFMAAFKSVDAALDYAIELQRNTGHPKVQVRAGIHIGSMEIEADDVFGGAVNFAARVVGAIGGAEIWVSDQVKWDIDQLGAKRHKPLEWKSHERTAMKGLPGEFTLWSVTDTP